MKQDEVGKDASVKGSRQDRLKLALRENLKRRKTQARGRSDMPVSEASGMNGHGPGDAPKPEG